MSEELKLANLSAVTRIGIAIGGLILPILVTAAESSNSFLAGAHSLRGALFRSRMTSGNCEVYKNLSKKLGCSDDGYLVRFGAHYCREFVQDELFFSDDGKLTLAGIRGCLQDSLLRTDGLSCENVERIAAANHITCYTKHNFCEMSTWDQLLLSSIISPALLDPDIWPAVYHIKDRCFRDFLRHL
jgi:hypothetical protein